MDSSNEKVGYKIRNAQMHKVPYMLLIGDKEIEAETVGVRTRKDGDIGQMKLNDLISRIREEIRTYKRDL